MSEQDFIDTADLPGLKDLFNGLSEIEQAVVTQRLQGFRVKVIAKRMGRAESTIKTHIKRINSRKGTGGLKDWLEAAFGKAAYPIDQCLPELETKRELDMATV